MLQRTPEWRVARCGKATASRVADVIARTKTGWGAARKHYMDAVVAERITGRPQDWKEVRSLTDRADMEPDARDCYMFYTGNEVEIVGFIDHPSIPNAGASPDGLVESDGMIELKCLDAGNHLKLISGDDSVMLEYLPQVDFGIACTEREWCDFVAFNPSMPEEMKLFVKRIERDDKRIAALETSVIEFLAEVDRRVRHIQAIASGKSEITADLEASIQLATKGGADVIQ